MALYLRTFTKPDTGGILYGAHLQVLEISVDLEVGAVGVQYGIYSSSANAAAGSLAENLVGFQVGTTGVFALSFALFSAAYSAIGVAPAFSGYSTVPDVVIP